MHGYRPRRPSPPGAHRAGSIAAALLAFATTLTAQQRPPEPAFDPMAAIPALASLHNGTSSDLAEIVNRFSADDRSLSRRYDAPDSPAQRIRMRAFYAGWRTRLGELGFDRLNLEGKVDYVLLDNYLQHQVGLLDRRDRMRAETAPLLPFGDRLLALQDARRNLEEVDPPAAARTVAAIVKVVDSLRTRIESRDTTEAAAAVAAPKVSRAVANRAAEDIERIRDALRGWYRYYDGFNPLFSWWLKEPNQRLDQALDRYARVIRERLAGIPRRPDRPVLAGREGGTGRGERSGDEAGGDNTGPIIGDPIGAEGLAEDLRFEMIPYTPEELIQIAEREYAFSLSEAKKAAREMGFGDDWKAAMEKVKNTYVEPGEQPELIRRLARQAESFIDDHDWVTIPPLAREDWRMEMLSPERQRVSPFFLGGEQILVSYPTDEMSDPDKRMTMRGNNPHFSHATVFHELNPGHHLQGFMLARYNTHRRVFSTPFWNEGQSLYWEMFLWDHGFQVSPEDRMGALFWRMHRSARIIFSLSFHLGRMTPEQAVEFLVDTVDFERANAEAEVRRSFNGSYSPLYQCAYMLGGLQLRSLHRELVESKRMSEREFHDAILKGGPMPIALERVRLARLPLPRSGPASWRFAESLPPPVPFRSP